MQPLVRTQEPPLEFVARGPVAAAITPEELCGRYAERVFRFAAMISRGEVEAEDLAQDALERAIRRINSFNPARGSIEGWLWQIVVHAAADAGRVARRRQLLAEKLRTLRPLKESDEIRLPPELADADLLAAVRALRSRDRTIIALRFGAGLPYAEIGRVLDLKPDAAAVAGRRALARLRHDLEERRSR
jgi:RNA polymerase sigma-70 factor (ECF subfamily)